MDVADGPGLALPAAGALVAAGLAAYGRSPAGRVVITVVVGVVVIAF
ncbi:hypothetical protein [Streptomyces sp. NBC_01198]|nr:hypothetical protein OG702_15135 [Streptomyces sp. NBC_01198]